MKSNNSIRWVAVFVVVILLVVSTLPALAAPARQDDVGLPEVPGLIQALEMLAQGLGVGFVVAFLFEKPGWFKGLSSDKKWWIVLSLSVGLPPLAQALLEFIPPDVWTRIEPYWLAIARGFLVWAGSQVAFMTFLKSKQDQQADSRS